MIPQQRSWILISAGNLKLYIALKNNLGHLGKCLENLQSGGMTCYNAFLDIKNIFSNRFSNTQNIQKSFL